MRILFDHGTPAPLGPLLTGHSVKKAKDLGWDTFSNGELLEAAERAGFELLLTTDKNIRHQQNLAERTIAIVVLGQPRWTVAQFHVDRILAAVNAAKPGSYQEVDIPRE
ncbi:MAG TPA: hypothetical protein VLW54_05595 [Candidatus Acidoferrales bacterium]|nr:hypothetical protein [Candidatus Acidoferrales bacterium]